MSRPTRSFFIVWVSADELLAAAREAGWHEDSAGGPLDYAPQEYHQHEAEYGTADAAIKAAQGRLPQDFFGQIDVEERELVIEPMDDGGPPLRSWETRRRCIVEANDVSPWEAVYEFCD